MKHRLRRLLSDPPALMEQVVAWLMLAVLVFAAFYFFVFGSGQSCDENIEQCEESVGPYQIR